MKLIGVVCCLVLVVYQLGKVSCLTNGEFYNIIKQYGTETEDSGDDQVEDSNVIELPGGYDDELDVDHLTSTLALQYGQALKVLQQDPKTKRVGFWHHHHHHHHKIHGSCKCHTNECGCCLKHTFKVIFKKVHLKICIIVDFVPADTGFIVTFQINGHNFFHKELSLKHPPKFCYTVPGFKMAKICLELYNIDIENKSLCARATGELDLKVKVIKVNWTIGCVKIPTLDATFFARLAKANGQIPVDSDSDDVQELELSDLSDISELKVHEMIDAFRALQDLSSYDSDE